jgi:hypothetical protein
MNDRQRVLDYLETHGSITPLDALSFGCYRLGARIWDLRRDGHSIQTEIITGRDMHGEPMRYARYILKKEDDSHAEV